jgi:hypothetical protein
MVVNISYIGAFQFYFVMLTVVYCDHFWWGYCWLIRWSCCFFIVFLSLGCLWVSYLVIYCHVLLFSAQFGCNVNYHSFGLLSEDRLNLQCEWGPTVTSCLHACTCAHTCTSTYQSLTLGVIHFQHEYIFLTTQYLWWFLWPLTLQVWILCTTGIL